LSENQKNPVLTNVVLDYFVNYSELVTHFCVLIGTHVTWTTSAKAQSGFRY